MHTFRDIKQPRELWEIFNSELEEHIGKINELVSQGIYSNLEVTRKTTQRLHRLKGSLGFVGFKELSSQVKEIEDLVKSQSINATDKLNLISQVLSELKLDLEENL